MTLEYFIPCIGQPELVAQCCENLLKGRRGIADITVIDNGSKIPIKAETSRPQIWIYRSEENMGMVKTLDFVRRKSVADIIVYAHSDFMLYEDEWNLKIAAHFEADPKLGLIGAVGAEQADTNGGRSRVWCSFRDGEVHGWKPETSALRPVVLLDGCFMAFRRSAMEDAGIPDLSFPFHHFYDKDISLSMHTKGWKVAVLQMDCEHLSGKTACQPECQEFFNKYGGEQAIYNEAEKRYLSKWSHLFPISV